MRVACRFGKRQANSLHLKASNYLIFWRPIFQNKIIGVLHFLIGRHKVPTHGTRRFPADMVFGELWVLRLRRVRLGPLPCAVG